MRPNLAEYLTELKARRDARVSLLHFTKFTFPRYKADPVHALIAATLDRCVTGEIKKLMIFAPPQVGKSELASVRFPAYWLGRRPDEPVILTSYGASLAENKSRQVRQIVESADFRVLFPGVGLRKDSRAVEHWELAQPHRGGLKAAGVGGPITGHGAALGLIDDPFESWEQAQSETIRRRIWDWYRGTFFTRIWEHGVIILIMTRWHEEDLAGQLLTHEPGEWVVLRLPAVAEDQRERDLNHEPMGLPPGLADPLGRSPGQPLAPSRYSSGALAAIRKAVGPLVWMSEYQGSPRAPEGNWFKTYHFPLVEQAPREAFRVRYWDKAGTAEGGKFTAGVLMAWAKDGLFYVEDVVRGQWSADEREKVIVQTAQLDRQRGVVHIGLEQEPGSGGKESAELTVKRLAGYVVEEPDKVTGSKDVRLMPYLAQAQAGNVRMVRGGWNKAYLDELLVVPNGKYRDQADGSAGAFNTLTLGDRPVALPRPILGTARVPGWGGNPPGGRSDTRRGDG